MKNKQTTSTAHEPIAIVGYANRFPQARNIEEYWNLLCTGIETRQPVPPERWSLLDHYNAIPQAGKSYSQWGCFIDDMDTFDPLFFRISPAEAKHMDPQQRLILELVWEAFEQGGILPSASRGSNTGVYIGASGMDYACLLSRDMSNINRYTGLGTNLSIIANRVSFIYDFHGPSFTIDTACSSSLSALHQACQDLHYQQCNLAVVGSVNIMLQPAQAVGHAQSGILSKDGHCRPFDQRADGILRGEGGGVVLLKRLRDAVAANDIIDAVIQTSAVNQDGFTNGIFAPNRFAQQNLLQYAWQQANIDPMHIGYIEAHGTGTVIGDPIEVKALNNSFQHCLPQQPKNPCYLGSVKANLGHLEAAAGMASLIKVILALKHRQIPPQINFEQANTAIDLNDSHLHINTKLMEWPKSPLPPCAAINSFSFGGSNAHVVLQAYDQAIPNAKTTFEEKQTQLIVFSCKQKNALVNLIERFTHFVKQQLAMQTQAHNKHGFSLQNLAYTLQTGREAFPERIALLVDSLDELYQVLVLLYQQLKQSNKINNTANIYSARANKKISQLPTLSVVQACNRTILQQYAAQWVTGQAIDWQTLHMEKNVRRIYLPSQPFVPKQYGFQSYEISPIVASETAQRNPLLGKNQSTLSQFTFKTRFTGSEPFLRDHYYQSPQRSQPLMPATAYLEMARAAGEVITQQRIQKIANILWLQPYFFSLDKRDVQISFKTQKSVAYHTDTYSSFFKIYATATPSILHSRGKVYFSKKNSITPMHDPVVQYLLPSTIKNKKCVVSTLDKHWWSEQKAASQNNYSGQYLYQHFSELPLHYQHSHQVVKHCYLRENIALAELHCPVTEQHNLDRYGLHPSMLDGVIQLAILSSPILAKLAKPTALYLPFSLQCLHIYQTMSATAWVYAQLQQSNDDSITVNVIVINPNGGLIASLDNLVYRKIKEEFTNIK